MADELKSALDAAARAADVTWSRSQVAVAVHRRADRRRRSRRLATVSAAGALVAVSIGGALVLTSNGDDERVSIVDTTPDTIPPPDTDPATTVITVDATTSSVDTATTEPAEPDTTETAATVAPTVPIPASLEPTLRIENPPLSPRVNPLIQWVHTGDGDDHIVYWGGHVSHDIDTEKPPFNDGAVWSRSTNSWTAMTSSPLAGGTVASAVVGSLVIISDEAQVATFNVMTNEWQRRENTLTSHPLALNEVLVAVGEDVFFMRSRVAWNSRTDEWRPFGDRASSVTEVEQDVVVTHDSIISIDPTSQGGVTVERYDIASDTWTTLPSPPGQHYGIGATVIEDGGRGRLVILSWWEMTAWSLDLERLDWTPLPDFPEFPVKCEPRLASYGSLVIGSMCGQLAVLGGDHWRPFILGSAGSVFDVLTLNIGQVVIRGALFEGDGETASISGIVQWSPLRLAGLTVDGSLQAGNVTNVDNETITLDLVTTGCSLSVRRTPPDGQTLSSDAVSAAAASPDSVAWWNPSGAYELACPSADAYAQSLVALRTEGERTSARDALGQFAGQGPWTSAEQAATELAGFVEALYGDQDSAPAIGLGYFPDDPNTFTIESVGLADDSVSGQFFTVTLQQDDGQWTIADATVADVCRRGVATTDPSLCV